MAPRHPLIHLHEPHRVVPSRRSPAERSGASVPGRRSGFLFIFLVSVLLFACSPATPPPPPAEQTQAAVVTILDSTSIPVTPTTMPDDVIEVLNGEYQLGATDALRIVQLTDGESVQGTQGSDDFVSVRSTGFSAVGDLNADGTDEVAVLVSENYGGTGVFVFLAIYANMDGTLTFQNSTMVDDQPELNALSIENGEIFLDAVIHGPGEEMCCPTRRTTRHYRFVDNQLDMTDYATFTPGGEPRTITIDEPANGAEVFSSVPIQGNVAIAPFENNLAYRIYDVSGIELAAGALAVTAPEPGAPGTFDAVIPLGNILSDTVIRIEVQDVSAEDGSLLAMDSVELVVK